MAITAEVTAVDYTYEREWRLPSNFVLDRAPVVYLFVETQGEGAEILELAKARSTVRNVLSIEDIMRMV